MTVTTALATFFLIWWVTLFAVLPWGIRSQHEGQSRGLEMAPGTDPGAPIGVRIGRKLLWTTLVAAVIYAGFYLVYTQRLVTLDELTAPLFGRIR
jgi:predicted secreted protein